MFEPKKSMLSDYKRIVMNQHCAKWLDEILENDDEQMSRFYQEVGLAIE
jgi:hypothetical protein